MSEVARVCLLATQFLFQGGDAALAVPHRDAEEVRQLVAEVLSDPEYRRLRRPVEPEEAEMPRWLRRLLDWLLPDRTARSAPGAGLLGGLVQAVLYLVAFAAVAAVLLLLLKSVLRHAADARETLAAVPGGAVGDPARPGELPCDEYERRALELARTGDYKGAIRQLVLGAMSWIERAELIRHRTGLTNRDYIRAVWRRPGCREALSAIVNTFELVYFGRRRATGAWFEDCLRHYREAFRGDDQAVVVAG